MKEFFNPPNDRLIVFIVICFLIAASFGGVFIYEHITGKGVYFNKTSE